MNPSTFFKVPVLGTVTFTKHLKELMCEIWLMLSTAQFSQKVSSNIQLCFHTHARARVT